MEETTMSGPIVGVDWLFNLKLFHKWTGGQFDAIDATKYPVGPAGS